MMGFLPCSGRWLAMVGCMGIMALAQAGVSTASWPTVFTEDFSDAAGRWRMNESWTLRDGVLTVRAPNANGNTFAYPADCPYAGEVLVEATVIPQQRLAEKGWSFAGICIYQDAANFWMLGLTEDPGGRRYMDFLENCFGVWQAQATGATRLPAKGRQQEFAWVPGKPYRLRLLLGRDHIEATIFDAAGAPLARGAYALPSAVVAVRGGVAALVARGVRADFDELRVRAAPSKAAADPGIEVETGPRGRVAIFSADFPGHDPAVNRVLSEALRQEGFGVTPLKASLLVHGDALQAGAFDCLVIPACESFPATGNRALTEFARRGGHIVFLGGPFLDHPMWEVNSVWMNEKRLAARRGEIKPDYRPFVIDQHLNTRAWSRSTGNPESKSVWEVLDEGPNQTPCLHFETDAYRNWEGYLSPDMRVFGKGDDMLSLLLKGDGATPQLAVEIQEEDGSRWIATVPMTSRWRRVAVRPTQFHYWGDSPTKKRRGQAGDHLHPERARRISFGLAHTHTPDVRPGRHAFFLADVGSAVDPLAGFAPATPALPVSFEGIWPRYKTYAVDTSLRVRARGPFRGLGPASDIPVDHILCAIPRTRGLGFDRDQKWRYIPLGRAVDAAGRNRGAPAWTVICRGLPFPGAMFTGFGFDSETLRQHPALLTWVAAWIRRSVRQAILTEGGTEHFAYWPGETVRLGCRLLNPTDASVHRQCTVSIRGAGSSETLWRQRVDLEAKPRGETAWSGAWQPPATPAVYSVRVQLEGDEKHAGDVIEHEFAVLDPSPAPADAFVSVQNDAFVFQGKPWYPVGINYWPLYVAGMDRNDYWTGWIHRRYYDPGLVEQDLRRMNDLGITMVSIQSHDPKFYRNLLDFLRRCGQHHIKVNLFCGLASPLALRQEALRDFIRTAHLRDNPTVFAYDIIWEPGNYTFNKDRRKHWDSDWRAWIVERYGSIERAEKDWGIPAPRNAADQVCSPPNAWFRQDGKWRICMAAYRRFMDDLTSSLWGRAERFLRSIDPHHLISYRQGNTLPHDFALTGTNRHIDFICPEGYSIPNNDDGYNAAGFITRYVDFTTGGKPIVWSEFGKSVWDSRRMEPSVAAMKTQAEYHDRFYRMVLEAGANGTVPWWWPGGYRVGERSDYGVVNPDGTPRASGELIRRYAKRLTTPRQRPEATEWFIMDRDAHAGGYWYVVFHEGMAAYRQARASGKMLGICTAGTGTTSLNTPLVALGGVPCQGDNPPVYLDAEFDWLRIQAADGTWVEAADGVSITVSGDRPIRARVRVGNLQEATWIPPSQAGARPGGVFLQTTYDSEKSGQWPISRPVPWLQTADFGEIVLWKGLDKAVHVELCMAAAGRTRFGEKRNFELVPSGKAK